jgi:ATP-dependent Clp protease ATP-binding subunit ClpC
MLKADEVLIYHQASQKLTAHAKKSILQAENIARDFGYTETANIHLLFSIFSEKGSLGSNILKDLGIKKDAFLRIFKKNSLAKEKIGQKIIPTSDEMKKTFIQAYSVAKDFDYPYVGTEHLVFALINSKDGEILKVLGGTNKVIKQTLKSFFDPNHMAGISKMFNLPEVKIGRNKKHKPSATPFIDKFCININEESQRKKEIVIGRTNEIQRMINVLGRKSKNNPILVGDPGVGKTVLVSGLSQLINSGTVPASLYGKRIMNLDIAQLIAGTSFRGEFESRLKEIIKEATTTKDIIIFIDEIHNIVGAGNVTGSLDLANIIKPALARGEVQVIGATTLTEYKKYIEKDAALERRFQPVQIAEPTEEETKEILFGIKESYEKFHNVSLSEKALSLAVELSMRYIQNRFLPDKAIDVIDETASDVRSQSKVSDFVKEIRSLEEEKVLLFAEKEKLVSEENYEKAISLRSEEKILEERLKNLREQQLKSEQEHRISITSSDILKTVARMSGVPFSKLSQEKDKKIINIKKILSSQIIGQEEVVKNLSNALIRSQSGIGNPDRPLGSFLFLGPTGVGKTLTAKILAQEFFGSSGSLIKIDMSELMERHSVSSLIGSPAGYVGYGEGGKLTEKIRRNPYSVVLFDEIEKAHPDVFNILLQILEDGVLTDAEGTRVSFKNTIVILTSNIGTDEFTKASGGIGFNSSQKSVKYPDWRSEKFRLIKENVLKDLAQKMKPELINRLDYILVFNALENKEIKKIAKIKLEKLSARLKKQGIKMVFSKNLAEFIAEKSVAPAQGARLVRKNVQELIENPVAEMIVYGKVKDSKIFVSVEKGKISLK